MNSENAIVNGVERGTPGGALDLKSIREKLAKMQGKAYWRSLNEVADSEAFQEFVEREFPLKADWPLDGFSRRNFMKVMSASMALAGLTSCARQPTEFLVPYVKPPEEIIPGRPMYYATASTLGGFGTGVLAESHMGRPTKLEGLPDHPSNGGSLDAITQASILNLYDPDRSQTVLRFGRISTWDTFVATIKSALDSARPKGGAGFRLLTETISSPTFRAQLEALEDSYPALKWHQYEPVARNNARGGSIMAFGEALETRYHFDKADIVLSLDSDFLVEGPGHERYARDFSKRREAPFIQGGHGGAEGVAAEGHETQEEHDDGGEWDLNRLYVVESVASLTGTMADHRLGLKPSQVESFARALARSEALNLLDIQEPAGDVPGAWEVWIDAIASDLKEHRGRSIIIAGEYQPPIVHAIAHALNDLLGNVGVTVEYTAPVEVRPVDQLASLRELIDDINNGDVETLLIFDANPVYSAPVDLDFESALKRVPLRVHLGLYGDETGELCHWHIPEAHFLEAWGDVRGHDGTVSIVQPLIKPLYGGKSPLEVLSVLLDDRPRDSRDLVLEYWRKERPSPDFDRFWRKSLSDGTIPGTAFAAQRPRMMSDVGSVAPSDGAHEGLEVAFRPDPAIWDGRFANNAWLQELPKPITKLTWDNAVMMSPKTAEERGLTNNDVVTVTHNGRTVDGPVLVLPGAPADTITIHLGYGRRRAGSVGSDIGINANLIRTSAAPWFGPVEDLEKRIGERYVLAVTEEHHPLDNREADELAVSKGVFREASVEEYKADPGVVTRGHHEPGREETLYEPGYRDYDGYAWGMTIDLNQCIGCNACAVACQAENNIPVVGREEVLNGREMNWIRIDRYYEGDFDNLKTHHQPVPCMQCENAPCEVVCPVGATQHSREGLNDMVYNRCIGTRYCSNNCPYKVRRFNFYNFGKWDYNSSESLSLQKNPDVTVRSRGVMEKCTYCVQRINVARIEAKKEGRDIRDGEIVTACQAACPTASIQFGNVNDKSSVVSQLKSDARNFSMLGELNARPRTTYLARLRNPNPSLENSSQGDAAREGHEA